MHWTKEDWDKIHYIDKDYSNYQGPLRIQHNGHIVIELTYACNMACINCNRLSNTKNKPKSALTIEDIKNFMRDWHQYEHPIRSISITGGEPTVHPDFVKIIKLLAEYCRILNMHLSLFTNGGKSFLKVKDEIPNNVNVVDSSKTNNYPFHYPFTVAPIDYGVYDPKNNPCEEPLKCGRTLNKNGYFVCPSAAAIDNFLNLNLGITGFANATEDALRKNAEKICQYCGTYMRYKNIGSPVSGGCLKTQEMSPFWQDKLKL